MVNKYKDFYFYGSIHVGTSTFYAFSAMTPKPQSQLSDRMRLLSTSVTSMTYLVPKYQVVIVDQLPFFDPKYIHLSINCTCNYT